MDTNTPTNFIAFDEQIAIGSALVEFCQCMNYTEYADHIMIPAAEQGIEEEGGDTWIGKPGEGGYRLSGIIKHAQRIASELDRTQAFTPI